MQDYVQVRVYCRQAFDPSTGVTCLTDPAAHPVLTSRLREQS